MNRNKFNILIGGEAGQGLATMGRLLVGALVKSGFSIFAWQEFESRIRGGHNTFSISVSNDSSAGPGTPIDILVALNEETADLHDAELSEKGVVIHNKSEFQRDASNYLAAPFDELVSGKFRNSVALGIVGGVLRMDMDVFKSALEGFFGAGKPEALKSNLESINNGMKWTKNQDIDFSDFAQKPTTSARAIMSVHEAVALGAMSAGLKFYSFYPMSPSTSIAEAITKWAKKMGIVVEQCEDEIAVLNMAIGASFAGAPSMVGTSGGGFALMTEAVSLAGASETPVVIVVAQRPGPATGLATRTAQGDLELVLHGGHGEFPRAIFAPGSVEECFHVTRKAFELAGMIQGPVIVLTDQFIADCFSNIEPFDVDGLDAISWGKPPTEANSEFLSYRVTDNGVSPRLYPGLTTKLGSPYDSEQLVIGDSHEHTEDGHLSEDRKNRKRMVDKRKSKELVIRENLLPFQLDGDSDPELLIVCWGSTKRAALLAMETMRNRGQKVGALHLSQVWPLPNNELLERLNSANQVVCVEGNSNGQLARLIRQETGFVIDRSVLQYDGRPIMPEWIVNEFDHGEGD